MTSTPSSRRSTSASQARTATTTIGSLGSIIDPTPERLSLNRKGIAQYVPGPLGTKCDISRRLSPRILDAMFANVQEASCLYRQSAAATPPSSRIEHGVRPLALLLVLLVAAPQ